MQILSKKRYLFKNGGEEKFITAGNGIIETAPDWVCKTRYYNTLVAAGEVYEISAKNRAVTETAIASKDADKAVATVTKTKARAKAKPKTTES